MKETENSTFIPYSRPYVDSEEMKNRVEQFYQLMDQRRTIRMFSDEPVKREIVEQILLTASTAPSGAHKQPWTFCAISNPSIKSKIREAAEEEEFRNYHGRMSQRWLKDLEVFGTNWQKPFLEIAPWIIVVFRRIFEWEGEQKVNNYYVQESVGLASGMLLTAIHHAGLVSLTHTPSPMNFLTDILNRPDNERPFLLIPVGYPAKDAQVPNIHRKSLEEVALFFE